MSEGLPSDGAGRVVVQSARLWLWGCAGELWGRPCGTGGSRAGEGLWPCPRSGRASPASPLSCTPQGKGEAAVGQCAGLAHGAALSPGLSLGRWEGGEEQGGAGQGCEGGGGEVEQPVGHLAVLAWCGAAAGRAWRAGCGGRRWRVGPGTGWV